MEQERKDNLTALLLAHGKAGRLPSKRVEDLLVMVESGEYGNCLSCKGEIELEHLRRLPNIKKCQGCISPNTASRKGHRRHMIVAPQS